MVWAHFAYFHFTYSHFTYSHFAYCHFTYSHFAYSHFNYSHFVYSHIATQDQFLFFCPPHITSLHITSLPKREVGALPTVFAFNHERLPMSYLKHPLKLFGQSIMYNGITSSDTLNSSMSLMGTACISYIYLYAKMPSVKY